MTKQEFINQIVASLKKYAPQYNIKCYSAILSQFILESGWGTSDKVYKNGEWRHNYAGLKWRNNRCQCTNEYFVERTAEQNANGSYTNIESKFFKFKSLDQCVLGYLQWTNTSNYANLKGVTDPLTYLTNIKLDKYATSIDYVAKCMKVVNDNNLTQYDLKENNMIKIAIDAGHGSFTSGKRTPDGYREHTANVKVASFFAKAMERCGIEYIRVGWNDDNSTDDVDTPLSTRQQIIRAANCTHSISFHFNAYGSGWNAANGIETLISNSSAGDSLAMANKVHSRLIQGTKQTNRGVKTQSLAMCNCGIMGTKASILVECAFMTNQYEAKLMQSDVFCLECAEEAALGFCEYVGKTYVKPNNSTTKTTTIPLQIKGNVADNVVSEFRKVGQIHCNNFTGSKLTLNGLRDAQTKQVGIKVVQTAMNLDYKAGVTVDGVWGAKSDSALGTHSVRFGEKQFMCTACALLLLLRGYSISLTGNPQIFSTEMSNAIKLFQRNNGLSQTGICDAVTFRYLMI